MDPDPFARQASGPDPRCLESSTGPCRPAPGSRRAPAFYRRALHGAGRLGNLLVPACRAAGEAFLDLLAPGVCRHCGDGVASPREAFCPGCLAAIGWGGAACARCALPIPRPPPLPGGPGTPDALPEPCGFCRPLRLCFDWAASGGSYEGALRTAVLAYKYQHDRGVLPLLVDALHRAWSSKALAGVVPRIDALVPVPLAWASRWWRGWDPGRELAGALARRVAGPPVVSLLRKRRWTVRQAGLEAARRRSNLRGAFRAKPGVWRGKEPPGVVAIVDDVLTTGATASECARALKRLGVRRVVVLTAARSV